MSKKILLFLLSLLLLLLIGCSQNVQTDIPTQPPQETSLSLDRVFIRITYGTTTSVTASYNAVFGNTLHFSVTDKSVVEVTQRGNVCYLRAVGFGKTTLTATYGEDTISVQAEVPYEENKLTVVHLDSQVGGDGEFPAILGQTLDLRAVLRYGITDIQDASVTYSVAEESVGTIDPTTGLFTPKKQGKTTVTVTATWPPAGDTVFTSQYSVTVAKDLEGGLTDFVVDVAPGKDIVILQLTDTQIIDPGQSRYPDRIGNTTSLTDADLESKCFSYIRRAVKKAQPDLIIITGDIVYGEFDDSGKITKKFIAFMDSLGIPWAPVFGNHDNETMKGVTWQCQQFVEAKNCLFRRGNVTGNGNYTIGIRQDGKLAKVIFMMDSNGCGNAFSYSYQASFPAYNQGEKIETRAGFAQDQLDWLIKSSQRIDNALSYPVSKFIATHIPMMEFGLAAYHAGYQQSTGDSNTYTIGQTVPAQNGDFGDKKEAISGLYETQGLWAAMQEYGFDGVFVGHDHKNTMSILYDGIRFTYGLKSSAFDYHDKIGGTMITIAPGGSSFQVKHLYD